MRRDSILLAVAFIAVAAAFVASTVVAQRAAREVGGLAASIARDAAPGLASMSNVRSEVRRLQELVTRVAVLGTLSDERAEIDETRRNLDFHLAEFRSLPTSEQELKLLSQLQTDIRSFDEAVERVIAHLGSHQPEKAALVLSAELRPLADEAAAAASKLVQLDAKAAEGAALRIEEVHRRADRMALEMDTLCVLLAVVAAWLVARAVANARKLQEEHRELALRRAEELEQFAGRVAHDVLSPLATVGLALSVANKTGSPSQRTALQRGSASLQRVRGIAEPFGHDRAGIQQSRCQLELRGRRRRHGSRDRRP